MQSSAAESTPCAGPTRHIVLPSRSLNLAWSGPRTTRFYSLALSELFTHATHWLGRSHRPSRLELKLFVLAGIIVLKILHTAGSNTFWEVTGV
jgi:hypothetical protein